MSRLIDTGQELEETLRTAEKLLVLFYASWCPFSQEFLPVFEKHSRELEHNCCRVLTDEVDGCEDQYSINVVPTVIYFEGGKAVRRLDGTPGRGLSEKQLLDIIDSCGLKGKK